MQTVGSETLNQKAAESGAVHPRYEPSHGTRLDYALQ